MMNAPALTHGAEHQEHHKHHSNVMKWALAGTAIAAGAVILVPYALPLVGIGTAAETVDAMTALHNATGGTGIAGAVNKAIEALPLVGETLAKGGFTTALTSGALGIGGVLLRHYSHKSDDGKRHINWGKVIGTAAMISSALIALPSILTGISAGIVFLSSFAGEEVSSSAVTLMAETLGGVNPKNLGDGVVTAASVTLPHLMTCGSVLPLAFGLNKTKEETMPQQHQGHPQGHHHEHGHHHHAAAQAGVAAAATVATSAAGHEHGYVANEGKDAVLSSVRLEQPTKAGEEVKGVLVLKHAANGQPLTKDELKLANEAIIHFFINNSSLTDYHHIHPTPTETPGEYAFNFKAGTSQPYTGFAAVVTLPDQKHRSLKVAMPAAINRFVPPNVRMNSQVDVDGLSFDWKMDGPMQAGKPSNIEVTIKDAQGKQVTDLQPVYGEWCHLEGFTANHGTMLHTHPTGREPQGKDDRMESPLHFTITPEKDGPTQFYVQVKRGDKDFYAPIGQYVKSPEKATDRVTARSSSYSSSQPGYGMGMA